LQESQVLVYLTNFINNQISKQLLNAYSSLNKLLLIDNLITLPEQIEKYLSAINMYLYILSMLKDIGE
jgi:hypothetical protein